MDQPVEKDKTERAIEQGGRTREEIAKWNQMRALRFQIGGETSDIPGLPSGDRNNNDNGNDSDIDDNGNQKSVSVA